ncbi:hypothetical protein ACWC9U_29395 [Streptomyces sp. 900116325]
MTGTPTVSSASFEYLRSGTTVAATASPVHDILRPGREPNDGLHLLSDGQWFWYSDLALYVERYHVTLDERFVQHAQAQNCTAPPLTHAELSEIEEALFDDDSA